MKKAMVLMITLVMTGAFAWSQATAKMGVVNSGLIMQKTKRGTAIRLRIEGLKSQKQKQAQTMQQFITKLQKDLTSPALNNATRQKKTGELSQTQLKLKRFYEDTQKELEAKFQKEMIKFQEQVVPLLNEVAKKKGLTMVFDLQRSGLAYVNDAIDITEEVIKAFDTKYPK
jgi:outer membrane protein